LKLEVPDKEVEKYCNEYNLFYIKVDGITMRGIKETFEYGPVSYMLKKENSIESMISRC